MSSIFKPTIVRYIDPKTGKQVRKGHPGAKKKKVRSAKWYTRTKVAGKWKAVPLTARKEVAVILAGQVQKKAVLANAGIIDKYEAYRFMPLSQHVEDWIASLKTKDTTAKNVAMRKSMVEKIIHHCQFNYLSDLSATDVENCLAEFRSGPKFGIQTSNHYLTSIRQFSRWLCRHKRMADDPFSAMTPGNIALDRRHDRRQMKDGELILLLQATARGPVRCRLSGRDREMLYLTAAFTGLRASELASLQPASFDLNAEPETVTVEAAYSKHRREDILPLHPGLVSRLKGWIEQRTRGEPLWPGQWAVGHDAGKMLKKDLHAARKSWVEQAPEGQEREEREKSDFLKHQDSYGKFCDFHALRHTFISRLVRSGAAPKLAQTLSRHSTIRLTMDHYAHVEMEEAVESLSRMPGLAISCAQVDMKNVPMRDGAASIKRVDAQIVTSTEHQITRKKGRVRAKRSDDRSVESDRELESQEGVEPLTIGFANRSLADVRDSSVSSYVNGELSVALPVDIDADLAALIAAWPSLPDHTKLTIMGIIEACPPGD